jgi:plastocyanin
MRRFGRVHLLAAVLVLALAAAACGGDDGNGNGDGGGGGGATGATGGAGDGTTITISGFTFSPATLEVSGETTITVTNEDGAAHTFTLDDGSVDQRVEGGETIEVTVNASETTGYHCAIHPQMTGTLEVA